MKERKSRLCKRQQGRLLEHFVAGSTGRATAELVGVNRNTAIIPNAKTETLMPIIKEKVRPDSIAYTDTWHSYNALDVSDFRHELLNQLKYWYWRS